MIIKYKDKLINIKAKKANFFASIGGLMFRSKETDNILFEFKNKSRYALHSVFVFFPFLVLWLDENNRVLDFKIVKPFSFYVDTNKKFNKILELPVNKENEKIIGFFT